jgi:hypothetical protein
MGWRTERLSRSRNEEPIMSPRKLLAVAVLASLPTVGLIARHAQPQASWVYAFDMDRESTLEVGLAGAVACSFFLAPGAIACGVVGAL